MTSTDHFGHSGHSGRSRALTLAAAASMALACGDATGPGGEVTSHDVSLGVGESAAYAADGSVLSLHLPSASSGREYRLSVQSTATGTPNQLIPMRLTRGDGSSGSGSVSSSRGAAGSGLDLPPHAGDLQIRRRIRKSSRDLLVRRGVRPARPSDSETGSGGDVRLSSQVITDSVPQEGDTIQFWFAAQEDFSTPCDLSQVDTVTAAVEVGEQGGDRAAIVQDTAAPGPFEGGFTDADFDEIAANFDTLVVPVDSAYFGTPTDIDSNQRVYILFTPKVNELDREDSDIRVGGFFVPNDLAESGDLTGSGSDKKTCASSNEAELLYLRSPDPNGNHGLETPVDRAKQNAFSVSSHELQHLLNAANRVIKGSGDFGDLETTWLSEALSHVAEEVVGLAAYDAPVRDNLTFSETGGADSGTFNTFLINDFYNAGAFMGGSGDARALATEDPDDGTESLEMRGFGWLFVRWLADQHASVSGGTVPGTGEESFIRDLAQADGGLSTGIDNVEGVTGASFQDLLADFDVMVAVDDDVAEAAGAQVLPTWNLRNMYRELAANTGSGWPYGDYPLNPVESGFTDGVTDFEVRPGPGKHFTISSTGSTPGLELRLTDQTGSALSSGSRARIVVFRAR